MELESIRSLAFELMGRRRSQPWKELGDKFAHGERVSALALKLRRLIFPGEGSYDDVLAAAALLHDVENGKDDHCRLGAETAARELVGLCAPDEILKICAIIAVHDRRCDAAADYSNAVRLHQDADHLDHFGTFDIWQACIHAVPRDRSIRDVTDFFLRTRSQENEQFLNELNFDLSRRIFLEKSAFVQSFARRLAVESTGGIWNEKQLMEEETCL